MTLKSFGLTDIANIGVPAQLDAEWFVDFTALGSSVKLDMSIVARIGPSTTPAVVSMWASSVEGDRSKTGTLLASIALPSIGTAGVRKGFATSVTIANPGGQKYVALISDPGA